MSFRAWASVVTALLLVLIIYLARHEITQAWRLLETVNLAILALLIPVQLLSYFAAGEMMFSYLRSKKAIDNIPKLAQARMALELNFVNHVLPSAGVSGISYMTWRLSKYGISAGRATAAQIVRYVAGFAAFITLLIVAVVLVTIDGNINRWIIFFSGVIIFVMVGGTATTIYLVSSQNRSERFARWITRAVNKVTRFITFGRHHPLQAAPIIAFFEEMHHEYRTLLHDRRTLTRPYLWGLAFTIFDVLLFMVTFWALGATVNPAPVLIAYGLAMLSSVVVVTPGGTGVYEAIMVSFLATAGVPAGLAIAATLLTRVIVLIGTIGLGYAFYQHSIIRHGKTGIHS